MTIYQYLLIIVLKVFAITVILAGLFYEARTGASLASFLITLGSLIFAIASNTTLFCVVKNTFPKKGTVIKNGKFDDKSIVDGVANGFNKRVGGNEGAHCNFSKGIEAKGRADRITRRRYFS